MTDRLAGPDYEAASATLATIAGVPARVLRERASREELLALRRLAGRVLDWREGQRPLLEERPERLDRSLEAGSWLVGIAAFVAGATDAFLNGLSAWGLVSLALAPVGFTVAAWQTQRRLAKERSALSATITWVEQVRLIEAALDKLDLALEDEAPKS